MAFYCNAECQRRSWKFGGHKNICKAAEISEPTGFVGELHLNFIRSGFS